MAASGSEADPNPTATPTDADPSWSPARIRMVAVLLVLATLALHAPRLLTPVLIWDDFEILTESWPWAITRANLFRSANEHFMPLGRLTSFLMVEFAPHLTWLPWITALQGPLAVLLAMRLLYCFVHAERNDPRLGLLAAGFFGISTSYVEAVSWFSASFSLLGLDMTLLGLLAAQRWRLTGQQRHLLWSIGWIALAPCWFASGILAGPLCALYLLTADGGLQRRPRFPWVGFSAWALTPLLGTVLFLAFSLPFTLQRIMHLEHYGDQSAVESFQLSVGVLYSARAVVDNAFLGTFGITGFQVPVPLVHGVLVLLVGLTAWWYWQAPAKGLALLGLGFVFSSYLLIHGARSRWPYEVISTWTRYQLYSHVGLACLLCAGWDGAPRRLGQWLTQQLGEGVRWAGFLFCVLFWACQVPRGWPAYPRLDLYHAHRLGQLQDLAEVEQVDARCRRHGIPRQQALESLGHLSIMNSSGKVNGWSFLRGCSDCNDSPSRTPEEVRRLLLPPEDTPRGKS